jgi:hypothetical protein
LKDIDMRILVLTLMILSHSAFGAAYRWGDGIKESFEPGFLLPKPETQETMASDRAMRGAAEGGGAAAARLPFFKATNYIEELYLKNRYFWRPFDEEKSLFTDPATHFKDKYLYLVHAPSQGSFDNPKSLKNLLISASLINQKHNKTFNENGGVFILKVPKNLIFATSPVDIGLDNDAIFPISFDDTGLASEMTTAAIKEKMTSLSSSNLDAKEITDQDVSDVASILKFGNRLRIELRNKFKKHGIHHPHEVMKRAAVRRLGERAWSQGHTEIVVLGMHEDEEIEIAGVLFFSTAPLSEKERFKRFASKRSLPTVELDSLKMNPTIEAMPSTETGSVQDLPIDWD